MTDEKKKKKKVYQDVYNELYYEKNKDKEKERQKAYVEENRDKKNAYLKSYREKNKDKVAELEKIRRNKFDLISVKVKKDDNLKPRWQEFAKEQNLTLTSLCEIAVDEFIQANEEIKEPIIDTVTEAFRVSLEKDDCKKAKWKEVAKNQKSNLNQLIIQATNWYVNNHQN